MQNNNQSFNEGIQKSNSFRETVMLDKKIDDLKKFFQERKLLHHTTDENKKYRAGLIEIPKILKNYGFITTEYIEAFSSGEESDMEEEKLNEASVWDACLKMIDFRTILNVKKISNIPKNARPGIILTNLDDWVNESILRRFIEDIPIFTENKIIPSIDEIRIMNYKTMSFGFVLFFSYDHCKKIYSYFNHPQKKLNNPTKNNKGEKIEIFYAFDLLDMKNSEWYGVILRNIPEKSSHEALKNFLTKYTKNINHILPAMKIKNSYCSLVVLDSLEDGEKLCKYINKKEMGKNKLIKAHIDPRSCKQRRNPENSLFHNFFKNNNGTYDKKYDPHNLGNILNFNGVNNNAKVFSITKILSNSIQINNLTNNILENKKSVEENTLKTPMNKEKESSVNLKQQKSANSKELNLSHNNNVNSFKKTSADFFNTFQEQEKNSKQMHIDINTSYLSKLINKSTKIEEKEKNDKLNSSSINTSINNIDSMFGFTTDNNNQNTKENRIIKSKETINKNEIVTNGFKKDEKSNLNKKQSSINSLSDKMPESDIQKINTSDILKIEENSVKKNKISRGDDENKLITENQEIENSTESQKIYNDTEIDNQISNKLMITNQIDMKCSESKASNNYIHLNTNNSSSNINVQNASETITNLNKILHDLKKSDKEKNLNKNKTLTTCGSGNLKTWNQSENESIKENSLEKKISINSSTKENPKGNIEQVSELDKNIEKLNLSKSQNSSKNLSNLKNISLNQHFENEKQDDQNINGESLSKQDESQEEIIDIDISNYDSDFFKYDFQEKTFYERPKNFRNYSRNKEEKTQGKSIYDRSRERDKERDKDKDRNFSSTKYNDRFSKKYSNNMDERNNNYFSNTGFQGNNNQINQKSMNLSNSHLNNPYSNQKVNHNFTNNQNVINYNNSTSKSIINSNNQNISTQNINNSNGNLIINNANLNKSRQSNFSSNFNNMPSNQNTSNISSQSNMGINNLNSHNPQTNNFSQFPNNSNNINSNILNKNLQGITNFSVQQSMTPANNIQYKSNQNISQQTILNNPAQSKGNLTNNINISGQNNFIHGRINHQIPFNPIIQNNSTIINNIINIIPSEHKKDLSTNTTQTNINFSNQHQQAFKNIPYQTSTNVNLVFPQNGKIINNMTINSNVKSQKNFGHLSGSNQSSQINQSTLNNLNQPVSAMVDLKKAESKLEIHKKEKISPPVDFFPPLPPENPPEPEPMKTEDFIVEKNACNSKINSKIDMFSENIVNSQRNQNILDSNLYANFPNSSDFLNPKIENTYEIKQIKNIANYSSINNNINVQSNIYITQNEKTEPGQIFGGESDEENSLLNKNSFKKIKKIDVKNAPINTKKYVLSRSSSNSSSLSYKKNKTFINKKRERERLKPKEKEKEKEKEKNKEKEYRDKSREREDRRERYRDKEYTKDYIPKEREKRREKELNREKYNSMTTRAEKFRDKERSKSKSESNEYVGVSIDYINNNKKKIDYQREKPREKKYLGNLNNNLPINSQKKLNKINEDRSSSSSSSFQSDEQGGRYYKRFMERRTNKKEEKIFNKLK